MLTTIPLPETKTHRDWAAYFIPAPTEHHDGTLKIVETKGVRVVREIVDEYQLSEQLGEIPGRQFILIKTAHTGDLDTKKGQEAAARVGEYYTLDLLSDGRFYCTCPGGVTRKANDSGPCCHALAVSSLIDDGSLPHPLDRAAHTGEDAANTEPERPEPARYDFSRAEADF